MEYLHVGLPVSQVLEYRRHCQRILVSNRVAVREWSLWARPEFLSFLIVEENDEGLETSLTMADVVDQVLRLAQEMGGTMEYCHGVGAKLAHLMDNELGGGMGVLRKIKQSLDPHNILNPGKLAG
jgi:FAD/FMN-containing dehydrogenase